MAKRVYLHDVNGAGSAWYNITDYVNAWPTDLELDAADKMGTLDLSVSSHRAGVAMPVVPAMGMEAIYYDHDANGAGQHVYYFAGLLDVRDQAVTVEGVDYQLGIDSKERHLKTYIPYITFDQATYPTEDSRISRLFTVATTQHGLQGTWDATTAVASGGFVTYPAGSTTPYPRKSIGQILDEIRADPGQATDANYPVPARELFVRGEWTEPNNVPGTGITWRLHYYSALNVQQELMPLTDRPDRMADYVADTFNRANSTTTMGAAQTSQAWASLMGTFGIDGNQAFLATNGSTGQNVTTIFSGVYDCEIYVTFAAQLSLQRLAFRVTSHPAEAYKWQGFVVQNEAGAGYSLHRFQTGVFTQLGSTYAVTPAAGDVIKVVTAGSSIKVYLNGGVTPIIDQTSSFNATATSHGIGQQGTGAARWDNFSVRAQGALHYDLKQLLDSSNAINIQAVIGPGADPVAVEWANLVGVSGEEDGSLTKTLNPSAWAASTAYSTGARVRPTKPNGRHYRLTSAGGTSGASEPTWDPAEGASTADGALVWLTEMWDAGATSEQPFTEDGGEVVAQVEAVWKASDNFDRPDDNAQIGKSGSGHTWVIEGVGGTAVWGIVSNTARSITAIESFATVETGVSACIVQGVLSTATNGARLIARYSDVDNCYILKAEATSYTLFRRQAGGNTSIGTIAITPLAGDICKLVLEDQTIQFYHARAGATPTFQFQATGQAHNEGASRHGFGITAGAEASRFDNFDVWQSYSMMAFGLGNADVTQSYTDIEFGWLFKADRTIRVVESGTERAATQTTYVVGDAFKVEVRQRLVGGVVQPVVKYYRQAAGATVWTEHYTSTLVPTISAAVPMYVDAAIYHAGATLSNVTMRRYTEGLYSDSASVALYGPYPAKEPIRDDTLDSETKRRARANAVFARHPILETVTCSTLQAYTAGRALLMNSTKAGWSNRRLLIPHVKVDFGERRTQPLYMLTLGTRRREYGDDEPLGFLLTGLPDENEEPLTPTGLSAGPGLQDSPLTVQQEFSWTQTVRGEQYIWIEIQRVGGQVITRERFSAEGNRAVVRNLPPNVACIARAQAQGYNGRYSWWTVPALGFRTASLLPPAAPTGVTVTQEGVEKGEGWVRLGWTHSTYPLRSAYELDYRLSQTEAMQHAVIRIEPDQNSVIVDGLALNIGYSFKLRTLSETGVPGPWLTPSLTHTVTSAVPEPLWDNQHPDNSLAGWAKTAAHTSTVEPTLTKTDAYGGPYVLRMETSVGSVAEVQSPLVAVNGGESRVAGSTHKLTAGVVLGSIAAHYRDWYDGATPTPTLISTSTIYNTTAAAAWPSDGSYTRTKVTAPATAKQYRDRLRNGAASRTVLFSSVVGNELVGNVDLAVVTDATRLAINIVADPLVFTDGTTGVGRISQDTTGSGTLQIQAPNPSEKLQLSAGSGLSTLTLGGSASDPVVKANAATGLTGNLAEWQVNAVTKASINKDGNITGGSYNGTTITGGGTLALGGFTLTVPATGTAALLGTANLFTAAQNVTVSDAATNTVSTVLALGHNTSAVPLSGFGSGIVGLLETSTTPDRPAWAIYGAWLDPAEVSRSSYLSFQTVNKTDADPGNLTEIMRLGFGALDLVGKVSANASPTQNYSGPGTLTYRGGGKAHYYNIFGHPNGDGSAYEATGTPNILVPVASYWGGKAGVYAKGANGKIYAGGGAGVVAIGGDGGQVADGNSAEGGAGLYAKGGTGIGTGLVAYAAYLDGYVKATGYLDAASYKVGGVAGVSGSFIDKNGLNITVTNGIITSIV